MTLVTILAQAALEFLKQWQANNGAGTFPTSAELEAHLHEQVATLESDIAAWKASKGVS